MPHWITIILDAQGRPEGAIIPRHGDAGLQLVRDDDPDDNVRYERFIAYDDEHNPSIPGYGRGLSASYDLDPEAPLQPEREKAQGSKTAASVTLTIDLKGDGISDVEEIIGALRTALSGIEVVSNPQQYLEIVGTSSPLHAFTSVEGGR